MEAILRKGLLSKGKVRMHNTTNLFNTEREMKKVLERFRDLSRQTVDFPVVWATWIIKNSYSS